MIHRPPPASPSLFQYKVRPLRHDYLVWFSQSFFVLTVLSQIGLMIWFGFIR